MRTYCLDGKQWRFFGNYKNQEHIQCRGFSLVELMLVVFVMGILLMFAQNYYSGGADQAKKARALQDMEAIRTAIKNYAIHTGRYPSSLDEIVGKYIEAIPRSPYGDLYQLNVDSKEIYCVPPGVDRSKEDWYRRAIKVQYAPR